MTTTAERNARALRSLAIACDMRRFQTVTFTIPVWLAKHVVPAQSLHSKIVVVQPSLWHPTMKAAVSKDATLKERAVKRDLLLILPGYGKEYRVNGASVVIDRSADWDQVKFIVNKQTVSLQHACYIVTGDVPIPARPSKPLSDLPIFKMLGDAA